MPQVVSVPSLGDFYQRWALCRKNNNLRLTLFISYEIGFCRKNANQFSKRQIMDSILNGSKYRPIHCIIKGHSVILSCFGGFRLTELGSWWHAFRWDYWIIRWKYAPLRIREIIEFFHYQKAFDNALAESRAWERRIFKTHDGTIPYVESTLYRSSQ